MRLGTVLSAPTPDELTERLCLLHVGAGASHRSQGGNDGKDLGLNEQHRLPGAT